MARSRQNDSASSQFFIMHETSPHLDGDYAVFGYVTSGMNIVDKICEDAKPTDNNGSIAWDDRPVMTSVTIRTENGK
jgi:peptidyl-prolyl cis-trans isomerase B (cyclophilin B)